MRRRIRAIVFGALIAAVVVAVLFFIPLPYVVFAPGAAIDLNAAIEVPHRAPPPGVLYLTDVDVVPGRPFFYVAARLLPGFELVRREQVAPPHTSDRELNRELVDAMQQSQTIAQVVAERAAGLAVSVEQWLAVTQTLRGSPGARCFRDGDQIFRIDGHPIENTRTLQSATAVRPAGTRFKLDVARRGRRLSVSCQTFAYQGKSRFGITVQYQTGAVHLPVRVTYRLPGINGSSAGLMFALEIHRTLTGAQFVRGRKIAGTGVLEIDGTVSPIEGAKEKIAAAKKIGASLFLVPLENYPEIRATAGIKVMPVRSFSEALHALQ